MININENLIKSDGIMMFEDAQVGPVSLLQLLEACCSDDPISVFDMSYAPYVYRFNVDPTASNQGTNPAITNVAQFNTTGDSLTHGSFKTTIVNTSSKTWSQYVFAPGTDDTPNEFPRGIVMGLMTTYSKTVQMPKDVNAAIVEYSVPIQWGYSGAGSGASGSIRTMGMRVRMSCSGSNITFPAKGNISNTRGDFSRGCSNVLSLQSGTTSSVTADERANRGWYRISTVVTFEKGSAVTFQGFADATRLGRSEILVGAGDVKIFPYALTDSELANNFGTVTTSNRSIPSPAAASDESEMIFSTSDKDYADQVESISRPDSKLELISALEWSSMIARGVSVLESRKAHPPTTAQTGGAVATDAEYDAMIQGMFDMMYDSTLDTEEKFSDAMYAMVAELRDPKYGVIVEMPWSEGGADAELPFLYF
jgi:hypothetical protein